MVLVADLEAVSNDVLRSMRIVGSQDSCDLFLQFLKHKRNGHQKQIRNIAVETLPEL